MEQLLGEIDIPKKNELSFGVVLEYKDQFIKQYFQSGSRGGVDDKDIKDRIKKDIDFEEPILRGGVEVGKGEKPVIVVNSQQSEVLGVIYNVHGVDLIVNPYYALVETTGNDPKKVEVPIKCSLLLRPRDPDHFMISQALATQLGIDEKKQIRLLEVYQKIEDVDLDKI